MFLGLQLDMSISRFYHEWPEDERSEKLGTLWLVSWISIIFLGIISIAVFSGISDFCFRIFPFIPSSF